MKGRHLFSTECGIEMLNEKINEINTIIKKREKELLESSTKLEKERMLLESLIYERNAAIENYFEVCKEKEQNG